VAVGCGTSGTRTRRKFAKKIGVLCCVCCAHHTRAHSWCVYTSMGGGWGGRRTTDDRGGGVHRRHDTRRHTHDTHTTTDDTHTTTKVGKALSRGGGVGTCRRPDHLMQRCYQGEAGRHVPAPRSSDAKVLSRGWFFFLVGGTPTTINCAYMVILDTLRETQKGQ
jgi:hypothetical protein